MERNFQSPVSGTGRLTMQLASILAVVLLLSHLPGSRGVRFLKLGFILPHIEGDAAIPRRLTREWHSAVNVALEVLGPQYADHFTVVPYLDHASCTSEDASNAAQRLVDVGVLGVVGPACSEAVLGASLTLGKYGIPLVSFAATSDRFREDRQTFWNVFRTSYGDRHQSRAVESMVKAFGTKNIRLFYSNETYGKGLAFDIKKVTRNQAQTKLVAIPYPPPPDLTTYFYNDDDGELMTADDATLIIFAVLPTVAQNLWLAAASLDLKLFKYPYWYFGTDGTTALDLVSEGDADLELITENLQGTLGVAPFKGDYSEATSNFEQFREYWEAQEYRDFPGLLTLPVFPPIQITRAYVPYLIDAIWSFFEAFKYIITVNGLDNVEAGNVVGCFKSEVCIGFKGTTGNVAFNDKWGERRKDVAIPEYSLVNLINVTWAEKAEWIESKPFSINYNNLFSRPGPLPRNASRWGVAASYSLPATYDDASPLSSTVGTLPTPNQNQDRAEGKGKKGGGMSTGMVVVVVLLCVVLVALVGAFIVLKRRKRGVDYERTEFVTTSSGFVRMI